MATKSPTQFHNYWGSVADTSELPNVSGATIQDAAVQVGDIAYSVADSMSYVCTTATAGSGAWSAHGGGSSLTTSQTIYVAKHGNDSNDGRSLENAKLTVGAALTVAAGLTPAVDNRISILIYAGRYAESITQSNSYVSLIGIGSRNTVEIRNNSSAVLSLTGSYSEIRNIRFTDYGGGATAFNFTSGVNNLIVNCAFVTESTAEHYLSAATGSAKFVNCYFEHANTARYITIFSGGTFEVYNCTWASICNVTAAVFRAYNCYFTSATSVGAETFWYNGVSTEVSLYNCYVDTTDTNGSAVSVQGNASIIGCYLKGGSNGYDLKGQNSSVPVNVVGTKMTYGMSATTRLVSNTHRVGPSGSCDFHQTLAMAITALGTNVGTVLLERDVSLSAYFDIPASSKVTIDGGSRRFSIASTYATLINFGANSKVTFKNVRLTDGDLYINNSGIEVFLDGCYVTRRIQLPYGDANTKLTISNTDVISGDTNIPAIAIGNVNPIINICNGSYIKGNGTATAIHVTADNQNITVVDSTLLHGDGTSNPITDSTGAANINICHSRIAAAFDGGNWTNLITTPYNVVDAAVANIPPTRTA